MRPAPDRLNDILTACEAIASYLERDAIDDDVRFDAIRVRLIEIGEAVKEVPAELRETEPGIPWTEVARMRDHLAHRYFDTAHSIVRATAQQDVPLLAGAVRRMLAADG